MKKILAFLLTLTAVTTFAQPSSRTIMGSNIPRVLPTVSKASVNYKLSAGSGGGVNENWWEQIEQTITVQHINDANGNASVLKSSSVAKSNCFLLESEVSRSRTFSDKEGSVMYILDVLAVWRPYVVQRQFGRESAPLPNVAKHSFDITSDVVADNLHKGVKVPKLKDRKFQYELDGYITYDPKTKTFMHPDKLVMRYDDPLTGKTEEREFKLQGTADKVIVTIALDQDKSKQKWGWSTIQVSASRPGRSEATDIYDIKYETSVAPPGFVAAFVHYWGNFVYPLPEIVL